MGDAAVGELVRRSMGVFTSSERRVARVLLAAYPLAGLETAAALAERAGVSGATVTRFVVKLGFDRYPALQQALRGEVEARLRSPLALYETRREPFDGDHLLKGSFEKFHQVLEDTFTAVPEPELDAVVALLADERRSVLCTGGRFSQVLAYYLHAHLQQLRRHTAYVGYGPMPRVDALVDVGPDDVVVAFDYRRYERDTVDFANRAADVGATIVLFTDPWLSPIAGTAEHVLPAAVEAPSPFDSIIGGLALVETVVAGLVGVYGDGARQRLSRLERVRVGVTWDEESGQHGGQAPGWTAATVDAPARGGSPT